MQTRAFHDHASPVIATQTGNIESPAPAATILNRVVNFWRRSKLTSLERLDDHMLDDIGVTRMDLQWARHLPLDRNPLAALDKLARRRSRERFLFSGRRLPGSRPV